MSFPVLYEDTVALATVMPKNAEVMSLADDNYGLAVVMPVLDASTHADPFKLIEELKVKAEKVVFK